MAKTFIKSKTEPNAIGPKYRTSDHFKGSLFGGGKQKPPSPKMKFNPAQFKTQHKG